MSALGARAVAVRRPPSAERRVEAAPASATGRRCRQGAAAHPFAPSRASSARRVRVHLVGHVEAVFMRFPLNLAAGPTRRRDGDRPPLSPRGLGETLMLSSSAHILPGRMRRLLITTVAPRPGGRRTLSRRAACHRAPASPCLALAPRLSGPGFARPSHRITGVSMFDGWNIGDGLGRKVSRGRTKSVLD